MHFREKPMRTDANLEGIEDMDFEWEDELPKKPKPKAQRITASQEVPMREVIIDTERLLASAAHWQELLTPDEQQYLSRSGYELKHFVPFGQKHAQPCLIKKNAIESYEHTFVVNMIADELRDYTEKVEICLTKFPDILFQCKGKEYAVEVETPLGLPKKHRRLALKAAENDKLYGKRWVFVVTQSAYAKCFKRYKARVLRRNEVSKWMKRLFRQ